jgi:pilus assembly protein Flp/PilA
MAIDMQIKPWRLSGRLQNLLSSEEGQDLIEYSLVVALIALAAITSMQSLAGDINNAFLNVGNTLSNSF